MFHRHTLYNTDMYHFQYDFNSIMHFPRTAYGKGSRITLQARHNPNKVLGGTDLSQLDIEKLNRMFCNDKRKYLNALQVRKKILLMNGIY